MGLVPGVVAFNGVLTGVGYGLLYPSLRGCRARVYASYGGVALLLGTGVLGVVLCVLAPLGLRIGLGAFAGTAGALALAGFAAGRLPDRIRRRVQADPRRPGPPGRAADIAITVAGCALVAVLGIALVGGFRSSPWLDDTWYFWLPKGRALDLLGLDPRLWHPNPRLHMVFGQDYESLWFIRPDNPLWWSAILNTDLRFVGGIDLRAVNGELAFLLIGFVSATARLLWGWVRPWILLPALLLVASAPELLRQTQGGDADVPLAIYLALAILAAVGWLRSRSGFALVLFVAFAATAIAIKSEGILELALDLAIVSAAGWRARRRLLSLWAAAIGAVATSLPWFVWRSVHDVPNVFNLRNAVSVSYLDRHTYLLHGALRILRHHFTSVREWSLIVFLTIALCLVGLVRDRRAEWLAPAGFLVLSYLLFVWISWADPEGAFRLMASAYRYVTPPIVLAGVFLPLLAERLAPARTDATNTT
jgi:hypothetical protein